MLRNVNTKTLTNVKARTNSLTTPRKHPHISSATLAQLSLARFEKKFVPLQTLRGVPVSNGSHFDPLGAVPPRLIHYHNMKLSGMAGTGSGKVGSMVYATVAGQQIVRQYQPVVANPSTVPQTNSRAKLKLASQLATTLKEVIAIPREGLKSSKNLFIKRNYGIFVAAGGYAQVSYENIQLTNGQSGLPAITATRDASNNVTMKLAEAAAPGISRVVFIIYKKTSEGALQLVSSAISSVRGENNDFEKVVAGAEGELVLYAYGMKDADAAATAKYGNLQVASADDLARLITNRTIKSTEIALTGTRGATMDNSGSIVEPVPAGKARVYVTASEGGTATGAGVFDLNSTVNVSATPAKNYRFDGWFIQNAGQLELVSNNAAYSFTLTGQTDLVAQFEYTGGGGFESGGD